MAAVGGAIGVFAVTDPSPLLYLDQQNARAHTQSQGRSHSSHYSSGVDYLTAAGRFSVP